MKHAWQTLLVAFAIAPIHVAAQPQVVIDINQPDRVSIRFERVPLVISDTSSRATLPLDLQFPGAGVAWRGLDFSVLSPANTGYRVAALSADGAPIAVQDFLLSDASSDPLARLPISDEPVLARIWDTRSGTISGDDSGGPPVEYLWNVGSSGGAGFGLFGSLEAVVVPEPSIGLLALVGATVLIVGTRKRC